MVFLKGARRAGSQVTQGSAEVWCEPSDCRRKGVLLCKSRVPALTKRCVLGHLVFGASSRRGVVLILRDSTVSESARSVEEHGAWSDLFRVTGRWCLRGCPMTCPPTSGKRHVHPT